MNWIKQLFCWKRLVTRYENNSYEFGVVPEPYPYTVREKVGFCLFPPIKKFETKQEAKEFIKCSKQRKEI